MIRLGKFPKFHREKCASEIFSLNFLSTLNSSITTEACRVRAASLMRIIYLLFLFIQISQFTLSEMEDAMILGERESSGGGGIFEMENFW